MAAKEELKSGIKALQAEMVQYDGTEGKTKSESDEYYAEQLATLIDNHAKKLVAKLTSDKFASLGLIAGPYPVTPGPTPGQSTLDIIDSPL